MSILMSLSGCFKILTKSTSSMFWVGWFLFIYLFSHPVHSILETDTHEYIFAKDKGKIICIRKKTRGEAILETCRFCCQFLIYNKTGYVVDSGSDLIEVLDLNTYIRKSPIKFALSARPTAMIVHQDHGFVVLQGEHKIAILNLQLNHREKFLDIDLADMPYSIVKNGHLGYVTFHSSKEIAIIDLEKFMVTKILNIDLHSLYSLSDVPYLFEPLFIYQDIAYFFNPYGPLIRRFDLRTHTPLDALHWGRPQGIYMVKGEPHVLVGMCSKLRLTNLLTQKEVFKMGYKEFYGNSLGIHRHYLYYTAYGELTVININTGKEVLNHQNPKGTQCTFSSTDLYLGTEKIFALPTLILFEKPFTGLNSHCTFDDPQPELMKSFEVACLDENYSLARTLFEDALNSADPKACALAAYAFLHGQFGADANDQNWFYEFYIACDKNYFTSIPTLPWIVLEDRT